MHSSLLPTEIYDRASISGTVLNFYINRRIELGQVSK